MGNLSKICERTVDMTSISYFGKLNSSLASVVPLAMFLIGLLWNEIHINTFALRMSLGSIKDLCKV